MLCVLKMLTSVIVAQSAMADLPTTLDLDTIRGLVVQHDGRWPPLDTVARDAVNTVTGTVEFEGHDPVLLLLAWTFEPREWMAYPLIPLPNAELREALRLPPDREVFSYLDLVSHEYLNKLHDSMRNMGNEKPDPLQSKVADIYEKLVTLDKVFTGDMIRPIPNATDPKGAWQPIDLRKIGPSGPTPVQAAWQDLKKAFIADDAAAFSTASDRLIAALDALPAAYRPDPKLIATELKFNTMQPFRIAWMIMVAGAVFAALAMIIKRPAVTGLAIAVMVAGFGMLTYGLSMRWQIAGRIPASNMYESLLFLSWGMGAFAILSMLLLRDRVVPLTASAMGALALVLAQELPLDHFIRPIVPVLLDTIWMSIHVPIIMVSYSVLTIAVLIAHAQLFIMAAAPRQVSWATAVDRLHYWYVHVGSILLLAGIITGSMWAASSWGRYWGWDPKEVWSLVAFLGYLTILHVRIDRQRVPGWAYVVAAALGVGLFAVVIPRLQPVTPMTLLAFGGTAAAMILFVTGRSMLATAVKSIVAFWLIVMTYVGVNYVLGIGLHSYGFGTGAVADSMFFVGGIDLAVIALLGLIYLIRQSGEPLPTHTQRLATTK